jgi:CheY-like chemotaxis protein
VGNRPGNRFTSKLFFPAASTFSFPAELAEVSSIWIGRGAVLIVDDGEVLRNVGRQTFEHLRLNVLTAGEGYNVLVLLSAHRAEIAYVILDLTMTAIDGEQAFQEMLKLAPDSRSYCTPGSTNRASSKSGTEGAWPGSYRNHIVCSTLRQKLLEALGHQKGAVPWQSALSS